MGERLDRSAAGALGLGLLLVLSTGGAVPSAWAPEPSPQRPFAPAAWGAVAHLPGDGVASFVVTFAGDTSAEDRAAALRRAGFAGAEVLQRLPLAIATGDRAAWERLGRSGTALAIEPDQPMVPALATAVDATRVRDLHLGRVPVPGPSAVVDGRGVGVAVIDGGIDCTHPDLVSRCVPGRNLVMVPPDASVVVLAVALPGQRWVHLPNTDKNGHGTHVAGIIVGDGAASGGLVRGVAPGARLYGYAWGALSTFNVVLAWDHLLVHPQEPGEPAIQVVNHSFGFQGSVPVAVRQALQALVAGGIVAVFAAGNDGDGGPDADRVNALCQVRAADGAPLGGLVCAANYADGEVGSSEGGIHVASSRGPQGDAAAWPDLAAPGTAITAARGGAALGEEHPGASVEHRTAYVTMTGTSMAAPHVAGVVALLQHARREAGAPPLAPAGSEAVLKATAHPFANHAPYPNRHAGHGLVDARAAAEAALALDRTPMPASLMVYTNQVGAYLASAVPGAGWVAPSFVHHPNAPGWAQPEGPRRWILPGSQEVLLFASITDAGGTPLGPPHPGASVCARLDFLGRGRASEACLAPAAGPAEPAPGEPLCVYLPNALGFFCVGQPGAPPAPGFCAPSPACHVGSPEPYSWGTDGDVRATVRLDLLGDGVHDPRTDGSVEVVFSDGLP